MSLNRRKDDDILNDLHSAQGRLNSSEIIDLKTELETNEMKEKIHRANMENETAEVDKEQSAKIDELKKMLSWEENDKVGNFINNIKTNDYLDFDEMKKIGRWWTHDVYMSKKNNKFILKINRTIHQITKENNKDGKLPPEISKRADDFIKDKNSSYKKLYDVFGIENCLYENSRIEKVKIDNTIMDTVIVVQESTDIFKKETIDFTTWYMNNINEENIKKYEEINRNLLGNISENRVEKEMIEFIPKWEDIFKKIDSDKWFAGKAKDFLLKFKKYYETEGKFIDLVGEKNVLFYQENNNREYKIWSVIKQDSKDEFTEALWILEDQPERIISEKHLKTIMMNGLACTRMLNSLGIKLGIGKIVNISLNETQIKNLNKIKL